VVLAASFLDWLAAVGTAVGALAAAGAVVVALFGPRWHQKQTQPKLSLEADPRGTILSAESSTGAMLRLKVHNARDKRTAEQVELFVSVATRLNRDEGGGVSAIVHVRDRSLNFDEPGGAPPGRSTTSVPSGYSRPVPFLMVGPPTTISERFGVELRKRSFNGDLPSWVAVPVLYPAVAESAIWLKVNGPYEVTLVVTGANFDAVRFRGELAMSQEVDDQGAAVIRSEWTQLPIVQA
jgi:hypothetical protein